MTGTLLCLGFGYTAEALARRLVPAGWRVMGTARGVAGSKRVAAAGARPVQWPDGAFACEAFAGVDAVLVSTPPDADGACPAFQAAGAALMQARLAWIGYLSANSVYGDWDGAWIDESAALRAVSPRGRARIAAETAWATLGARLFRLPGIYGPGRSAIDTARAGRAQRVFKDGQVFNRIHVDDIAAALQAALALPAATGVFNLSDDEPAPPQDVVAFACALLGLPVPPLVPLNEAGLGEMARSFYEENKRVRNDRMKRDLNFVLQYPTYREGLVAIARETA